jgi:hypothetical protein
MTHRRSVAAVAGSGVVVVDAFEAPSRHSPLRLVVVMVVVVVPAVPAEGRQAGQRPGGQHEGSEQREDGDHSGVE